ncbi:hypothetical protein DSO57_1024207 [Entomophthora muscae]|uniref:Uncharacterized protein n=1 Tax=Entomophthora muscae TaxID=34485 RepID=A0ACC2T2R0_9FUNG|nr:hypothetical protein DSO57_1024207 [Entomophthora muscae]
MKYIVAVLAAVSCQQSVSQKYDYLSLKVSNIMVIKNNRMKCAGLLISNKLAVTLAACAISDASKMNVVVHTKRKFKSNDLDMDPFYDTKYDVSRITMDPAWNDKAHKLAFLEIKTPQMEDVSVGIPTVDDYQQESQMVVLHYINTTAYRNTRHEVEPIEYKLVEKEKCSQAFGRNLLSDDYCLESSKIRDITLGSPVFFALPKDTPKVAGIINGHIKTKNSNSLIIIESIYHYFIKMVFKSPMK